MNPQDEASMLRDEAEYIKQDLDAINKRIEELEAKSQQA
jgi:ubiquinone biosynthesis protein UbiJ